MALKSLSVFRGSKKVIYNKNNYLEWKSDTLDAFIGMVAIVFLGIIKTMT